MSESRRPLPIAAARSRATRLVSVTGGLGTMRGSASHGSPSCSSFPHTPLGVHVPHSVAAPSSLPAAEVPRAPVRRPLPPLVVPQPPPAKWEACPRRPRASVNLEAFQTFRTTHLDPPRPTDRAAQQCPPYWWHIGATAPSLAFFWLSMEIQYTPIEARETVGRCRELSIRRWLGRACLPPSPQTRSQAASWPSAGSRSDATTLGI